jgi:TonB family protein
MNGSRQIRGLHKKHSGRVVGAVGLLTIFMGACSKPTRIANMSPPVAGGNAKPEVRTMAALSFDPEGADFSSWVSSFKDQIYRNWVLPAAVVRGEASGKVDIQFTVERDGKRSALRVVTSSGTLSLDRASEYAVSESKCPPLPNDYRPSRVTMLVSFYFNEVPK